MNSFQNISAIGMLNLTVGVNTALLAFNEILLDFLKSSFCRFPPMVK